MMRVGLFTDTYLPDINGVVSSVELLRKKLNEEGHEVFVICTYPGLLKIKKEDYIIRLPGIEFKKLYGYAVASPIHLFLLDDIRELNLDIIHVHTEFGVGIFAQMCADRLHIPLVRTYHTTYEDYTHYVNILGLDSVDKVAKKLVANISKSLGERCLRLISPSLKTKEMLIRYGIKTNIDIIPTGTELDHFEPSNTSLARIREIREECGIKDGYKMILYVGRIAKEKSLDMLVDTFKLVKSEGVKLKLVVIGGGPDLDNLIQNVEDNDLSDYIFVANKRPFSDIPAYYHSADAFVSASTTETQGMTYIEALASKLVIFARRDEALSELLFEGKNGYYFDDSYELFDKLKIFNELSDEEIDTMSTYGKELTANYDANTFALNIMKCYEEAIKEYHHYYIVNHIKLVNDCVKLELESNFVKEEVMCSLDDFNERGIRVNETINFETYDYLKSHEPYTLAYSACLKKLALKDYTIKQMYDFIIKEFDFDIKYVNMIIDRLIDRKLLDDEAYTLSKIISLENKFYSSHHIINVLRKDGVGIDIITKLVKEDMDVELEKAIKMANKYANSIHNKSVKMKKNTILNKLMNEGFGYRIASEALSSLSFNDDISDEVYILRKEAKKVFEKYRKKYDGTELRNRVFQNLYRKGFTCESIYAIMNEMEDLNDD